MNVVTSISDHLRPREGREAQLRRLAVELAVQLPTEVPEALRVLGYTETIVRSFLADSGPKQP